MRCCKIAFCECVAVRNAARAQRLVELDGDLVPLLQSHMKEGGGTPCTNTPWWGETDDVRQRKLNRMVAVRQHEGGQDGTGSEVKTKVTVKSTTWPPGSLLRSPLGLLPFPQSHLKTSMYSKTLDVTAEHTPYKYGHMQL